MSSEIKSSKNWVPEGMDTEKLLFKNNYFTFSVAAPSPSVIFRLFFAKPPLFISVSRTFGVDWNRGADSLQELKMLWEREREREREGEREVTLKNIT